MIEPEFHRKKLDNGLTVIFEKRKVPVPLCKEVYDSSVVVVVVVAGRKIWNVVPMPGVDSTSILPLCFAMME